jgi:hypothetical protein
VGAPVVAAYAAGQMFYFVATGDNTGAVTLNIDSLGAKAVTRDGSVALAAGDIKSGEVVVVVYDGTRFQVVSQLNSAGNATFANVSITSALNVGGVATFTANPVLSGGTANGVLYLNGSKVATSGSALTYDGTTFTSGAHTLSTGVLTVPAGSAAAPSITTTGDTNTGIFFPAADTIAFTEGGAESMRINSSGNVGISEGNAPTQVLSLYRSGSTNAIMSAGNSNTGLNGTLFGVDTAGNGIINQTQAFATIFSTSNTERLRLDSSGNLGLGVTPSAWSGFRALQIGGTTSLWSSTSGNSSSFYTNNGYFNGSNRIYLTNGFASEYIQGSGQHIWYTAASGTAGGTISFTQAMTLDASGNLGIGTSSPTVPLEVQSNSGGTGVIIRGRASANSGTLRFYANNGTTQQAKFEANDSTVEVGSITNVPLLLLSNGTERARITSGGVLCVGTTATNNADCVSLRSSTIGNTNVGLLTVVSGKSGDAADCLASFVKFSNTNTTSQVFIKFGIDQYNSGSGQINANGASQAAFGSFSDRRLKDNIVDLASQWGSIKALRPVEFDYIASEGGGHQLGFIAQEVKEVYPDLVGERADKMLTLSGMGKNEARLIKALQEAMARIEQLEAKFAALESK